MSDIFPEFEVCSFGAVTRHTLFSYLCPSICITGTSNWSALKTRAAGTHFVLHHAWYHKDLEIAITK